MKGDIKITRDGKTRTFTKTTDGYKAYDGSRITKKPYDRYEFHDKQTGTVETFRKTSTGARSDDGSTLRKSQYDAKNSFTVSGGGGGGGESLFDAFFESGPGVFLAVFAVCAFLAVAPLFGGPFGIAGFIVAIIALIINYKLRNRGDVVHIRPLEKRRKKDWHVSKSNIIIEYFIINGLSVSF